MLIDITYKVFPKVAEEAQGNQGRGLAGHLGTHFDVMDKEFPLAYTRRKGIVLDVSGVCGREIGLEDVDLTRVEKDMFVAFHTGYIEREPYGSKAYFSGHPELAHDLITVLVERGVSIIGVDCAGVRRGKEHTPADQYCADRGVFVVENLCGLQALVDAGGAFIANTYPMNYAGVTGLPCRVIAEV